MIISVARPKNNPVDFNEYIEKLKQLPPPADKKIEFLLRTLANSILDRIIEEYDNNDQM